MTDASIMSAALSHLRAGRLEEARHLYEGILAEQPDDPDALHFLGIVAHQSGRHEPAIRLIRRAIVVKPDDAKAHNNLGNVLAATDKADEAEAAFRRAIDLDPAFADAHFNLGVRFQASGRLEDAAAAYQRALDSDPGHAAARNNLAIANHDLTQLASAANSVDIAVREAARFYRAGRLPEALRACRLALAQQPDHAATLNLAGVIALRQGDADQAAEFLRQAIAVQPDHAEAQGNLGNVLRHQGKLVQAITAHRRAIEIDGGRAELHANLADTLQEKGALDDAVAVYQRALVLDPNQAQVHNNLATALKQQDKMDEALAVYERAVAIDADYLEAHYNAARVLHDLGREDEALACYHQVLRIAPTHHNAAHMVSALTGVTTEIAPEGYVRDLFDYYSADFDEHLVEKIGYRIPVLMRQAVDTLLENFPKSPDTMFPRGLDLGCGTGMVGAEFTEIVDEFHGVDLAPKMVERAVLRGVYDAVFESELGDYFETFAEAADPYDLVLAADLFIYVGRLDAVFAAVGSHMTKGGLFVFSVETLDEGTYVLRPSGRYAQSDAYIDGLASANGFAVTMRDQVDVRKSKEGPIKGILYVLEKV